MAALSMPYPRKPKHTRYIEKMVCKDLRRAGAAFDAASGAVVARIEAQAAACDAAVRGVPNPDEDQVLEGAASAGDPGTVTYIVVKHTTSADNKLADAERRRATKNSVKKYTHNMMVVTCIGGLCGGGP